MSFTFRTLLAATALGGALATTATAEDVTLRYLASHGGISPHELAKELGYFDGTGIALEYHGYASGGPESLIALAGGSVDIGSADDDLDVTAYWIATELPAAMRTLRPVPAPVFLSNSMHSAP